MKPRFIPLFNDEPGATGGGDAVIEAPAVEAPVVEAKAAPEAPETPPAKPAEPPAKSALSGAADEWAPSKVPEKYQVKNDKGELDVTATFRKVEEHRASLEKRLGAGGVRPKSADDYKLPDTDTFKGLALDDAGSKAFRAEAHEMGLSQAQYESVMSKYAEMAPALVNAGKEVTADDTIAALTDVWKDNTKQEIAGAYGVAQKLAEKSGVSFAEMDAAIGNNPVAIRMLASLAKEMAEDSTPASANGAIGGGKTITELMADPAYSDIRNPNHQAISAQVRAHFAKTTPKDN